MRIAPYGSVGWLVSDVDDLDRWVRALDEARIHGVEGTQLGSDSVLVRCDAGRSRAVRDRLAAVQAGPRHRFDDDVISVRFDPAGLALVAERAGLDADAVAFRLCATTLHVACFGPSPASPLMVGLDRSWDAVGVLATATRTDPGDVLMSGRWCRIQRTSELTRWIRIGTTDAEHWYATHEPRPTTAVGTRIRLRPEVAR